MYCIFLDTILQFYFLLLRVRQTDALALFGLAILCSKNSSILFVLKNFLIFDVLTSKKKGEKDEKNFLAGTLSAYGSNRRAGGAESSYRRKQMASPEGHAE